jgi:hypothetical protein
MTGPISHRAKWAFTTRRARRSDCAGLAPDVAAARPGDLLLAAVERIGSHKRVQLACGRLSDLWPGDLIVAACGDRYAVDQFDGIGEIDPEGCDLLAGGGVVGRMASRHDRMAPATRLTPLGRLVDAAGAPLTLARYARPRPAPARPETVIVALGAGMNSGKTTAAAALIRGLSAAGIATAGLKATGTGAFGDLHAYADAGAGFVADFTECGLASTCRQPLARIEAALDDLLAHAAEAGCEAAVVEIADGLLQPETAELLESPRNAGRFDGALFAAGDALSAAGGLVALERLGIRVLALSGLVTRAPLAVAEAEAATGAWVLGRDALADPATATALLSEARATGLGGTVEIAA